MKRLSVMACMLLLAAALSGCETPGQSAKKNIDAVGSATMMLTGHRPTRKKPEDNTKKVVGVLGFETGIAALGVLYYLYNEKGKKA